MRKEVKLLGVTVRRAQRGTCHMRTSCRGPEVKTQKCMHKYYLDMYMY